MNDYNDRGGFFDYSDFDDNDETQLNGPGGSPYPQHQPSPNFGGGWQDDPTQLPPRQGGGSPGSPFDEPTMLPNRQAQGGSFGADHTMIDPRKAKVEPLGFLITKEPIRRYGQIFTIRDNSTMGSQQGNEHVLYDQEQRVSRNHLKFLVLDHPETGQKQFKILDLGSRNGTELNGREIRAEAAFLNENDEISLGGYVFVFKALIPSK